jgi:biotin carboxyl carrier protein
VKKYNFKLEGKDFNVEVDLSLEGKAQVLVNGKNFNIDIGKEKKSENKIEIPQDNLKKEIIKGSINKSQQPGPDVQGELKSLMPGKIIEVLVSQGQSVKMGEPVLKMESMKMEQVIVATSNGNIKKINVNAGDTVEVGLVMIVIE